MKIFTSTTTKNTQGFTILFAVIITGVVVLLGTTIAGIYQREALLTSSSQESSRAFYAADTALECVMFYDRSSVDAFATSSPNLSAVNCLGVGASNTSASGSSYPYYRSFLLDSETICAGVSMEKRFINDYDEERTYVEARGRSTCRDTNRKAERALRTAY